MHFFKKWELGKNYAISVLKLLKNLFYLNEFFKIEDSFNPDAARNYSRNYSEYRNRCIESVNESLRDKYSNEESSSLKFSEFTDFHGKLIKNLKERPEKSDHEKVEGFKNWLIGAWKDSMVQNSHK